jgi:hypothetical protein
MLVPIGADGDVGADRLWCRSVLVVTSAPIGADANRCWYQHWFRSMLVPVDLLAPIDTDADRSASADQCWCRSVFVPIDPSIGLLVAIDVAIVEALPVAAALLVPIYYSWLLQSHFYNLSSSSTSRISLAFILLLKDNVDHCSIFRIVTVIRKLRWSYYVILQKWDEAERWDFLLAPTAWHEYHSSLVCGWLSPFLWSFSRAWVLAWLGCGFESQHGEWINDEWLLDYWWMVNGWWMNSGLMVDEWWVEYGLMVNELWMDSGLMMDERWVDDGLKMHERWLNGGWMFYQWCMKDGWMVNEVWMNDGWKI